MPKKWMRTKAEWEKVLNEMDYGFLGLSDQDQPYVIPISYAYQNNKIYLHTGLKGLKLECLKSNPQVCFTVAEQQQLVSGDHACDYGVRYRSVIARGHATLLQEYGEKLQALQILAARYCQPDAGSVIDPRKVDITTVIVIEIEEISGKYNIAI
ncbi:MAG: pyridoxamine 5'-phosphate oxidase family protein [Syntrophomonadaceae bacterium]|nr:pyridoxamine 5'-phosphate oxidase family protein [Syntrophomonadaceae bacterium]